MIYGFGIKDLVILVTRL